MKRWEIQDKKSDDIIEQLLLTRGIKKTEIDAFLNPDFKTGLNNPSKMLNMKKAVLRISQAKERKEKVAIFGDYDADGIPGSVLIHEAFKKIGVKSEVFIAKRAEGYGLNEKIIKDLIRKGFDLIVCVDNGTKNTKEINRYYKQIDFIICDHHEVGKTIPKSILLNPKQKDCRYPFKNLSGCGVVYKFVQTLADKFPTKIKLSDLKWWTELVAISTICDVVPLVGENRVFAKFGLMALKKTKRVGLLELYKIAKINPGDITTYTVGFQIGPRLNAPARLNMHNESFVLLSTNNLKKAEKLSIKLNKANLDRQKILNSTLRKALKIIEKEKTYKNKLILISGKNWPQGVVGLVAGKIVESYARPTIVLSTDGKISKGSARSVDGYHMVEALEKTEKYLIKYGGHYKAAGLSLENKHLNNLYTELLKIADKVLCDEDLIPKITIDGVIDSEEISIGLVRKLAKLEPFGLGNPKPIFVSYKMEIKDMRLLGSEQNHLKLFLYEPKSEKTFSAIGFDMKDIAKTISIGDTIDIVYYLDINVWNGNENIDLKILDLRKHLEGIR